MTVQEMIEALRKLPPQDEIKIIDSDGYWWEPSKPDRADEFAQVPAQGPRIPGIAAFVSLIPIDTTL